MKTWHERLTFAREQKGLKKSAFARLVEVSAPTVTDWENGETKMIDGLNMVRVCQVLGISAAWLMTGEGDMRAVAVSSAFQSLAPEQQEMVVKLIESYTGKSILMHTGTVADPHAADSLEQMLRKSKISQPSLKKSTPLRKRKDR
jgi:transcriptional regulator with XRE-family HTH domain